MSSKRQFRVFAASLLRQRDLPCGGNDFAETVLAEGLSAHIRGGLTGFIGCLPREVYYHPMVYLIAYDGGPFDGGFAHAQTCEMCRHSIQAICELRSWW